MRYPARADVAWDELEGRIVLALPRPLSAAQRAVARLLFPIPEERLVSLEGPAAQLWRLADGGRNVEQIAREMRVAPEQAARFAEDLAARGFLALRETPAPVADAKRGLDASRGWQQARCRRCRTLSPLRAGTARWFCPRCRKLNG